VGALRDPRVSTGVYICELHRAHGVARPDLRWRMNILVCVKRVPATGGTIVLTPDAQDIDTRYLGFTISPHEECAVEEAVRLIEKHGGSSAVMTLGPGAAEEQLRDAMAIGIERAVLLETSEPDWDPVATASALADAIRAEMANGQAFDLLLFGNEAADTGDYQVPVRIATALGLPCISGIKALEIRDGVAVARREASDGGWDVYELPLPAVVSVKEGINLPRYPSVPGRLRAKKKDVVRIQPKYQPVGPLKTRLRLPEERETSTEILGTGPEAAPRVVEVLQRLGVLAK
jgi:electron transfer flavoprotein beta subunit